MQMCKTSISWNMKSFSLLVGFEIKSGDMADLEDADSEEADNMVDLKVADLEEADDMVDSEEVD